ncbi:CHAT domain-containing protein [Streptosporangiaceae bacterium NEAU-GS5]|nr:CHAT domain-containing protein [Streptosporangiaceae bacterium NEAU-GS5]
MTDSGGRFLADHEVRLQHNDWRFEAFTDLYTYLRWNAVPDRRLADEARILTDLGAWIGEHVLGDIGPAMVKARPDAVRVIVPSDARVLAFRPLSLGHVSGKPLALHNVPLVFCPPGDTAGKPSVRDRLRVLGLFSLPTGTGVLNLRRERHALTKLFSNVGAVRNRAVELHVLQYGVTRERLTEVLEEDEGWDVVHVSGHGSPGEIYLEKADGSPDRISADELVDLLDLTRDRLKLVTVSACWSAALTAADQMRSLGLTPPTSWETTPSRDTPAADDDSGPLNALATALSDQLDCAVLAMRYPVVDSFAINVAEELYELLADKGQKLPRAVAMTMRKVVADPPTFDCPALSVATPALFGPHALGLSLQAPQGQPIVFRPSSLAYAGLPPQPDRFVGRVKVMTDASAALAPGSGLSGLVLHGMPSGGKTACALELAYTHADSFGVVLWHKAPDEGADISGALDNFVLDLERKLAALHEVSSGETPLLQLVHLLADPDKVTTAATVLRQFAAQNRMLFVLDNAESLLTSTGTWRDERWKTLLGALVDHGGFSRLIVTSRVRPDLDQSQMPMTTIGTLPLRESLLLARELPALRDLMDGTLPGVPDRTARDLAARAIDLAQGHPKLLELADGQAADPARLTALLEAAGGAWRETTGDLPVGFFSADGELDTRSESDYLSVLEAWTNAVAGELSEAARDLFWFICCLEDNDRFWDVLEANWSDVRARLHRSDPVPELDGLLGLLARRGLLAVSGEGDDRVMGVHPGVAGAGRSAAGAVFGEAADRQLAVFWWAVFEHAREGEQGMEAGGLMVRAGSGAVPYLLRLAAWQDARWLLEQVLHRDRSRGTVAGLVAGLRRVAAGLAGGPEELVARGTLGRALLVVDPGAGEQELRAVLALAEQSDDAEVASALLMDLVGVCVGSGRLAEALELAGRKVEWSVRAGLGPWSRLAAEALQVQVLSVMGQAEQVAERVRALQETMAGLPTVAGEDETVEPWNVREGLLDIGHTAALQLGRWEQALTLTEGIAASQRARGAGETETARTRFNVYGPLLRLGRVEQAWRLLVELREIFERRHDLEMLGKTLSALADVEHERGHGPRAVALEQDALRYKYAAGDVRNLHVSHHNLGNYLVSHAGSVGEGLTHHLAATLLRAVTGQEGAERSLRAAADDLRRLKDRSNAPGDVAALCRVVGQVPGVRLDSVLAQLATPDAVEQTYAEILTAVTQAADAPDEEGG